MFRLLDSINPLDNTFGGPFEDLDDRRIPLWMLRGSYNLGNVGPVKSLGLEAFWVPGMWDASISPWAPKGTPYSAPLAEGLLPKPALNWVKKRDFVLDIGELNYDEKEYFDFLVKDSLTANIGKYDVNEKDIIIDVETGKPADFVSGLPFPDVDPEDPKAGQKFLYNKHYAAFNTGNQNVGFQAIWVGTGGLEREIGARFVNAPMDGYPPARSLDNSDGIQRYTLISVDRPYDISGFSLLLWRYRDQRQDMNLSYIPAIRRVRRMSPANRSDAFVGSDFCIDDPNGYDGKICTFDWRVLRKQEALIPYKSKAPERLVQNNRGEWVTTEDVTPSVYGFQTEGWQGAPWAPVKLFWVKRSV